EDEPFKKLINQGKIQGRSNFVYRVKGTNKFVSYGLRKEHDVQILHVDIDIVNNDVLDTEAFKNWLPEYKEAEFILEDGKYVCGHEVEKMSKSKHNVQNPDALIERYGADTLRLYEMFLGPLEQDKPWDTNGIEGVFRFLKKLWRLYFDDDDNFIVTEDKPSTEELKSLHKTIKKVTSDIERFSFNTGVSAFMICVNELNDLGCHKKEILEPLAILLSPYAPHITEEIGKAMGYKNSISTVEYPVFNEEYLTENNFEYPVSFNGKMRFKISLPVNMTKQDIEKAALEAEDAQKWIEDKTVRKVIVVPNRIINIVVS
ncbi:MAG: class I tRNA ligase family protein, partial [Bacteroidales bacterium]|nr:class I tRNA ligase family protein [Bacteroidales bacterium]